MDIKKFAEMLDGKELGFPQFTKAEIQIAKDNGFVIVYGESDDLMEFDGAIYAETGCYDGGKVYFNEIGVCCDEEFENSRCIEALWCDDETKDKDGSLIIWTYKTDIPHETFMILEDGESYCRGIVFDIKDLKTGKERMTENGARNDGKKVKIAIDVIKGMNFCGLCTTGNCKECERKMAKDTAINALESKISMELKPPKIGSFTYKGICPICENEILISENYCSQCGQKITTPSNTEK